MNPAPIHPFAHFLGLAPKAKRSSKPPPAASPRGRPPVPSTAAAKNPTEVTRATGKDAGNAAGAGGPPKPRSFAHLLEARPSALRPRPLGEAPATAAEIASAACLARGVGRRGGNPVQRPGSLASMILAAGRKRRGEA